LGSELYGERGEYLEGIERAAGRMRRLINDLLALSRVTTRGQPFVLVALRQLVEEVLENLALPIEEAEASIELGLLPDLKADPGQLRQLFQNLLGNALKFRCPDVLPRIRVAGRLVPALEAPHEDPGPTLRRVPLTYVEVEVADNGIGFDDKYLDRIFVPFERLHGQEKYEGTGMGLAICRRITERHGGTITASGTPGQGATFRVCLPLHPPEGER
jgi:signal transduction histidine kinase